MKTKTRGLIVKAENEEGGTDIISLPPEQITEYARRYRCGVCGKKVSQKHKKNRNKTKRRTVIACEDGCIHYYEEQSV